MERIFPFFKPALEYQDERFFKKVFRLAVCLFVAFGVTWIAGWLSTGDPSWTRYDIASLLQAIMSRVQLR